MTEKSDEVVLVVDNDESVRYAIANLIAAIGLIRETFASASEFFWRLTFLTSRDV